MYDISQIAAQLNFAFNTGASKAACDLAGVLYTETGPSRQGGRALVNLNVSECQCVGLAFAITALYVDFGDDDINSVAAENAYYCLARGFVENDNTFCMPAIFSILYNRPELLADKFISSFSAKLQKESGVGIGFLLGGNPFAAPQLAGFRTQAVQFTDNVMFYVLSKFFDVDRNEFLVPTDLHIILPKKSHIHAFLNKVKQKGFNSSSSFLEECKSYFNSIYSECEDTLLRM